MMAQLEKEADEDEEVYEKVTCWLFCPWVQWVGSTVPVPQAGGDNRPGPTY